MQINQTTQIDPIHPNAIIRLDAGHYPTREAIGAFALQLASACNAEMEQRPALHGTVAAAAISHVDRQIADETFRSMATSQRPWHLPDLDTQRLLALGMASQRIAEGDDHALRNGNLTTDEHPAIPEFRSLLRAYDASRHPPLDSIRDPGALVQEGLMECLTGYGVPRESAFHCLAMLQSCLNDRSRFVEYAERLVALDQDGRVELHGLETSHELAGLLRTLRTSSTDREAARQYMEQHESRYGLLLQQAAMAVAGPGLADDVSAGLLTFLRELDGLPEAQTQLARVLEHLSAAD